MIASVCNLYCIMQSSGGGKLGQTITILPKFYPPMDYIQKLTTIWQSFLTKFLFAQTRISLSHQSLINLCYMVHRLLRYTCVLV